MKKILFASTVGLILALGSACFAVESRHDDDYKEAPLPALGLTLLGQVGAAAFGWRIIRRRQV